MVLARALGNRGVRSLTPDLDRCCHGSGGDSSRALDPCVVRRRDLHQLVGALEPFAPRHSRSLPGRLRTDCGLSGPIAEMPRRQSSSAARRRRGPAAPRRSALPWSRCSAARAGARESVVVNPSRAESLRRVRKQRLVFTLPGPVATNETPEPRHEVTCTGYRRRKCDHDARPISRACN
jgi:hypothetical protein